MLMATPRSSQMTFVQEYQKLLVERKAWLSEKNLTDLERSDRLEELREQAGLNASKRWKASQKQK
jgi:hypothetical protein